MMVFAISIFLCAERHQYPIGDLAMAIALPRLTVG